jgi:hypothetical protein
MRAHALLDPSDYSLQGLLTGLRATRHGSSVCSAASTFSRPNHCRAGPATANTSTLHPSCVQKAVGPCVHSLVRRCHDSRIAYKAPCVVRVVSWRIAPFSEFKTIFVTSLPPQSRFDVDCVERGMISTASQPCSPERRCKSRTSNSQSRSLA